MNKSFFFNADTTSGSADITYSAADLAAEKAAYFSDGVLAPDDFKVSAVDSLTVKIAPGGAVLGGYTYVNSSIGVRAISSAAATKARRDLCVLKLDLSIRAMTVVIKSGMPSDDPQPPALTSTDSVKELALAEIYMPAGASSVNEATVTDLRMLASLRGASALIEAGIKAHEAETDALTKSENTEVRKVCGAVKTDGTSGEVLCGDGKYRTVLPYRRTLLQIYNRAGEYEFDTSKNPSDANRYDFEMIGGGGAGGCCGRSDSRGGGGGAGAYVSVCGVTLSHGTHKIKIGAGGSGSAERSGGDGGESSFAGYHAPGGSGRRYGVSRRERRCCRRVDRRARRRRRVFPSVRQNRVLRNRRAVSVRRGWCRSLGFFILRKEGDRRRIGRIGRRLREHLVFRLGRKRRGRLPPDIRISYDGIRHRRRMRTLLYPADGRRRSGEGK